MPRRLHMPSEGDLPRGARRDFVEELWLHYRQARRPTMRDVADGVAAGDYRGTTSREQFRRMMAGLTVPTAWDNVEAVLLLLCERGGTDPESDRWPDDRLNDELVTWRSRMFHLWNAALDESPARPAQPIAGLDGWPDEAPF